MSDHQIKNPITISIFPAVSQPGQELYELLLKKTENYFIKGYPVKLIKRNYNMESSLEACFHDDVVIFDGSIEAETNAQYLGALELMKSLDYVLIVSRTFLPYNFEGMRDGGAPKAILTGTTAYCDRMSNAQIAKWIMQTLEESNLELPRSLKQNMSWQELKRNHDYITKIEAQMMSGSRERMNCHFRRQKVFVSYLSRYSSNHLSAELELAINGRRVRHSLSPGGGGISVTTLVSGTVALGEFLSKLNSSQVRVSPVPVAQWGREPLDYSGLRSVWISSTDRLPTEVETALMRWVFGGGTLVVCVPPDAAWPEGEEPDEGVRKISHGWGTRILCRLINEDSIAQVLKALQPFAVHPASDVVVNLIQVSTFPRFDVDAAGDRAAPRAVGEAVSARVRAAAGGAGQRRHDRARESDGH